MGRRHGYHRAMPSRARALPPPDGSLARTVAAARAFLIDVDGVLVRAGRALPGAAEALAALDRRGLLYRLATNTSLVSRATLARQAAAMGLAVEPERIVSALSVTAALTARRYPGRPLYVLCADDAREEFAGQRLLDAAGADAVLDGRAGPEGTCPAVVIGDGPGALTYDNLDRAFRLVRGGSRLIAMHRNPWWITPRGPTLDTGAFVAGLEYATQRRATVVGKPSPAFFAAALRDLGQPAHAVVMVGDDLRSDIAGAHRAGMRAVWVRSGKDGPDDLARHAARGRRPPDGEAADLAAVVAALPER